MPIALGILIIGVGVIVWFLFKKPEPLKPSEPELMRVAEIDLSPKLTESYLTLSNFVGQANKISYLKLHISQVLELEKPLPHLICWGPGGLGKSTLAKAVAAEMGTRFIETIPANLKSVKDLLDTFLMKTCPSCGYISPFSSNRCLNCREPINVYFTPYMSLHERDIIYFEECHRLRVEIEEAMYSLMQDGYMIIRFNGVDQRVEFPPLTVIGATTLLSNLNKPFRDRFKLSVEFEPYTKEEITQIVQRYLQSREAEADLETAALIASLSHGIPRIAKRYCDDSLTLGNTLTVANVKQVMRLLEIDRNGLGKTHKRIMDFIQMRMNSAKNGGAGAKAIATTVGLKEDDYLELFEPGLLYQGYIYQGARGRRLTEKAISTYYEKETQNV